MTNDITKSITFFPSSRHYIIQNNCILDSKRPPKMPHIPFIARLSIREYSALVVGLLLLLIEGLIRIVVLFLPQFVVDFFTRLSGNLFHRVSGQSKPRSKERVFADKIRHAKDFGELCELYGYVHEEHVVLTKDGYLLCLHRLPSKAGEQKSNPGTSTGKPVVYLHHGLLMNSEIWVCLTTKERALPFVLAEKGYDVWLGNNRGNKYSKKSIHYSPNDVAFWDYSMDDFAFHDIPNSIEYILNTTKVDSLSYVGFSQGSAQAFAALSIHPQLNEKVNVFIALAPAVSPAGLAAYIVDGLMKSSPRLMFLLFGRKSILSSTVMWQQILYPPIFTKVIDSSLNWLFAWTSSNISPAQKIGAYAHLYSFASVKSVVHWFQIMRSSKFQLYDDDITMGRATNSSYRPARFPTKNIMSPIVLLYGDRDSLVDIDAMTKELPSHTEVRPLQSYEHLDIIWGKDVHEHVIPHVLSSLKKHGQQKLPRAIDAPAPDGKSENPWKDKKKVEALLHSDSTDGGDAEFR